jgi:hypothetical protein
MAVNVVTPPERSQNATGPMTRTDSANTTLYPHSGVIHEWPKTG